MYELNGQKFHVVGRRKAVGLGESISPDQIVQQSLVSDPAGMDPVDVMIMEEEKEALLG